MPKEKMPISERAKIFAPFDALKGFRELLVEQEFIKEEKKILSDDMIEELSSKLNMLKVGFVVEVKHYNEKEEAYQKTVGVLTKLDNVYHKITIVKQKIDVDNILDINIIEEFNI